MSISYSIIDKTNPVTARSASKVDTLIVATGQTGKIIITEADELWVGHVDIEAIGKNFDFSIYGNYRAGTPVMSLVYTVNVPATATTIYRYFISMYETYYKQAEIHIKNNEAGDTTYYYFIPTAYNQGIPLRKF